MTTRQHRLGALLDDINILLLGQTGVGKTTFINAFASYLVYNSLDEAMEGLLQAIIPAWFTFMDKDTFEEKTIVIGTPDQSEKKGAVGQSCTKECRSFVFQIGDRKLRLIDAPGIGDTQGVLEDEKKFEDILAYISQFDYLNGICILLKPNEERMHILFRFCIKELLRHLHVHARQNLMFVFTNARATSYQPGTSAPVLRSLLKSLQDKSGTEVPFSRENSFLFDSESFRFLSLYKNGITFGPNEKNDYSRSWDYSIHEFSRLMKKILLCDKHATRDTLSLNEAQQLIRKLSRPIGEIATLIEENLELAQQHKSNIRSCNTPTPHLLPQLDVRVIDLGYPRTVCANEKCTQVIVINGIQKVDYVKHCHPHCYLQGVQTETLRNEKLKVCDAMNPLTQNCKICGCSWEEHQHITYELEKFMNNIDISSNNIQDPIETIEERIENLKKERESIMKVCAKLTQFLKANSLNPVNDDILEYIQHFIREEQTKKVNGAQNDNVIEGLRKLAADYKNEMEILEQGMRNIQQASSQNEMSLESKVLQPEEIFLLVGKLYHLPINGTKIRAQVDELKHVQNRFSRNREQTVHLPAEADSSSVMVDLKHILT